ncbi:hypothetical protein ONZ45_g19313 [Pleurotus djamor]|nr:hypothetical protein ONZ45_g19313 [Pleurotus djamor]
MRVAWKICLQISGGIREKAESIMSQSSASVHGRFEMVVVRVQGGERGRGTAQTTVNTPVSGIHSSKSLLVIALDNDRKYMTAAVLQNIYSSSSPPTASTTQNGSQRGEESLLSSSAAESFRTAPPSPSPLSPSLVSVSTVSATSPGAEALVNPIHHLAVSMSQQQQQQSSNITSKEVHVVKVTQDAVHITPGPVDSSHHPILDRVGKAIDRVAHHRPEPLQVQEPLEMPEANKITYPPSPPASDDGNAHDTAFLPAPTTPTSQQVIFDEPEAIASPRERQASTSSSFQSTSATRPGGGVLQRAATDARVTRSIVSTRETVMVSSTSISSSRQAAHISVDGYLHPPSISITVPQDVDENGPPTAGSSKPTRRNTTGSFRPQHATVPSTSHIHFGTTGDEELASDIQMAAEQIRRERASKRVKAQQKAEEELERTERSKERDRHQEDTPLVGNLIGKDHVNYVLMYNMLTGIRIGVSRCQAKMKRALTDDDFTARHKFSFDIVGNELTPSTTYDFKFKDYAPWVFRTLREDYFHLDPADYLLSLTSKYILSELGSPGKSGSFFYFSRDYRFIIKTIRKEESTFLRKFLKQYYNHVKTNPHTLISRFYGLHRVKLPRGKKIHFVIMNNLFPPHRDVHETYDLKGSTIGRYYPEEKLQQNPRAVLKDINWIKRGRELELGPEKRALLTEQLRRDKEFLKEVNVMDYSLLVGIHDVKRGNREGVRSETLKVFSPDLPTPRRSMHAPKGMQNADAIAMRRAMRSSDPKRLGKGKGTIKLPEKDTGDTQREGFVFYMDEGGFRATDENNDPIGEAPGDRDGKIYYLGIIDILTPYGKRKKVEHLWKGLKSDRHKISPVPAAEYADRFFEFMKAIMRGGGGGEAFMNEKDREHFKQKTE